MTTRVWPLMLAAATQAACVTTFWFLTPLYMDSLAGRGAIALTHVLVFALPEIGGFFLSHLVGSLSDAVGRVKVFIVAGIALQGACVASLLFVESASAVLMSVCAGLACRAILKTTLKVYATRAFDSAHGRGLSQIIRADAAGWLLAGIAQALFLKEVSRNAVFVMAALNTGAALVATLAVAFYLPPLPSSQQPEGRVPNAAHSLLARMREDLGAIYADRNLLRTLAAAFLIVIGNWVFISSMGLYVVEHLGQDGRHLGILNISSAISTTLLVPFVGRLHDRHGARASLQLAAGLYIAAYGVMLLWPHPVTVWLAYITPAFAALLMGAVGLAAQAGAELRRGSGVGTVDGLWSMCIAIGALIGGVVSQFHLAWLPAATFIPVLAGAIPLLRGTRSRGRAAEASAH